MLVQVNANDNKVIKRLSHHPPLKQLWEGNEGSDEDRVLSMSVYRLSTGSSARLLN